MRRARHVSKHFGSYLRGVLRGHPGVRIGRRVRLKGPGRLELSPGSIIGNRVHLWVGEGATLRLGRRSKIGPGTKINAAVGVTIGEGVEISWEVQVLDTDFHWTASPSGRRRAHASPIVIEPKVLIGTRALLLKGVTVGTGSVVGAGSVVRRDVPPRTIVAGNPAEPVAEVSDWA